ncbi:villin [Tieghemostelium lacteum]|uniref:Villin n=1 Tax=Tieghemostelium lacteum TaxID=361077 RepID=A0A151Z9M1_TIELA|nr:villin [Tieghemostelium lacteum]|eukprot:KYQ90642.1 villin [Tieghemostelium lacteum]
MSQTNNLVASISNTNQLVDIQLCNVSEHRLLQEKNLLLEKEKQELTKSLNTALGQHSELLDKIKNLEKEKEALESRVKILEDEKKALESRVKILEDEKKASESRVNILEDRVKIIEDEKKASESRAKILEDEKKDLESRVKILEDGYKILEDEKKASESRAKILEDKLKSLESSQNAITIREAMRCLEGWIAVNIVGSKTSVKKNRLYTIPLLENSTYKTQLELQFSVDFRNTLLMLKDIGDQSVHTRIYTKDELLAAIEDDDDNDDAKKIKISLVDQLEYYCKQYNVAFGTSPFSKK